MVWLTKIQTATNPFKVQQHYEKGCYSTNYIDFCFMKIVQMVETVDNSAKTGKTKSRGR